MRMFSFLHVHVRVHIGLLNLSIVIEEGVENIMAGIYWIPLWFSLLIDIKVLYHNYWTVYNFNKYYFILFYSFEVNMH